MDVYYQADQIDQIIATRGDLIAFQRRWLKMLPYLHFAVCTVDSVADRQAIAQRNGDRYGITK